MREYLGHLECAGIYKGIALPPITEAIITYEEVLRGYNHLLPPKSGLLSEAHSRR
jgi:hypothetical protein